MSSSEEIVKERAKERIEGWTPRTKLGKMIQEGHISYMEEIFMEGLKIHEPEIVDVLLPDLREEVININLVQKQTDAGEKSRFKAIVAVGNGDGYVGLGSGKAKQVRTAIEKAAMSARLNITLVRRGCGSWECGCGKPHSLPFQVRGKCGSVEIVLVPGPRGLGLVANEAAKVILGLAGVKDCWTRSFGSTRTIPSFAYAVFDALRKTYSLVTPGEWVR
ncbi:MAG: 30S ribosomal protein S5 [Candidatus Bathyarchaeota archaeon BA1]|nr:MAG: 30S ribosomal protein S5 [Candidatus Bathyarchaeota archaeon BA1]